MGVGGKLDWSLVSNKQRMLLLELKMMVLELIPIMIPPTHAVLSICGQHSRLETNLYILMSKYIQIGTVEWYVAMQSMIQFVLSNL